MGRSRKRSRSESDDESEDLRRRIKRLERKLAGRDRKSSRREDRRHSHERTRKEGKENRHTVVEKTRKEKGNRHTEDEKENRVIQKEVKRSAKQRPSTSRGVQLEEIPVTVVDCGDTAVTEEQSEASLTDQQAADQRELRPQTEVCLNEEILQVLGEDPSVSKVNEVNLHPDLATRWTAWITSGLSNEIRDGLLKKYGRTGNCTLEAPKLNPEMEAFLTEAALIRYRKFIHEQNLVGSALSALGAGITMILREEEQPVDVVQLLECLSDAGKLLTDLHHSEFRARKAFISPGISKQVKVLLDKADSGKFSFGENLADRIKEAKSLEKLGQDLKGQQPTTVVKKNTFKPRFLNLKGPSGRRQGPPQMGNRPKFPQRCTANPRGRQFHPQPRAQNSARPQTTHAEVTTKS